MKQTNQTWKIFNVYYNSNISDIIYAMQWHSNLAWWVDFFMRTYAHFDDLDFDARSLWKQNQRWLISATKQVISIKFRPFFFLHDVDFENIYMAWLACYNYKGLDSSEENSVTSSFKAPLYRQTPAPLTHSVVAVGMFNDWVVLSDNENKQDKAFKRFSKSKSRPSKQARVCMPCMSTVMRSLNAIA